MAVEVAVEMAVEFQSGSRKTPHRVFIVNSRWKNRLNPNEFSVKMFN